MWDHFFAILLYEKGDFFAQSMCFDVVTFFDGLSFFVLLFFHRRNFVTSMKRHSTVVSTLSTRNTAVIIKESTAQSSRNSSSNLLLTDSKALMMKNSNTQEYRKEYENSTKKGEDEVTRRSLRSSIQDEGGSCFHERRFSDLEMQTQKKTQNGRLNRELTFIAVRK